MRETLRGLFRTKILNKGERTMQVGTGKSILNGIAIGKLKIYKKKDTVIR